MGKKKIKSSRLKIIYFLVAIIFTVALITLFIHMVFMPMQDLSRIVTGFIFVVVGATSLLLTNNQATWQVKIDRWAYNFCKQVGIWPNHPILYLFFNKTLNVIKVLIISIVIIVFGILIMLGVIDIQV